MISLIILDSKKCLEAHFLYGSAPKAGLPTKINLGSFVSKTQVVPVSGVFFPIETLPEFIQPFSEILPLSIVADAMRSISSDGLSLLAVYKNMIGISIWIIIGTFISTKLFVWKEVAG